MKTLIILLLLAGMAWGEEITETATITFVEDKSFTMPEYTMSFDMSTGQISINGVPVKEMSHPDILKATKAIAEQLTEGNKAWSDQCGRQTDYLLMELERCRNKCKGGN